MRKTAPIRLLVLQTTPFCNIDCSYCYVPGRSTKARMADDILTGIAENILLPEFVGEEILVSWHSGEPLTLPHSYYRNALGLLSRHRLPRLRIKQHFQTNGTRITEEWVRFFHEVGASVSVSIDGPKECHDRRRVYRSGKGTHDAAMRGIQLLREGGIYPSVICVLTEYSLRNPALVFDFFEQNGFETISFNIEETVGSNKTLSHAEDEFSKFLDSYMRLCARQRSRQQLRGVNQIADKLFHKRATGRFGSLVTPFDHLSVDVQGNYWTYSPELGLHEHGSRFFLGNCRSTAISDAARSPSFLSLKAEVDLGVALCRMNCNYFDICGGGSPAHKFAELGCISGTETHFCRANIKSVTDVLTAHMFGNPYETTEQG